MEGKQGSIFCVCLMAAWTAIHIKLEVALQHLPLYESETTDPQMQMSSFTDVTELDSLLFILSFKFLAISN